MVARCNHRRRTKMPDMRDKGDTPQCQLGDPHCHFTCNCPLRPSASHALPAVVATALALCGLALACGTGLWEMARLCGRAW